MSTRRSRLIGRLLAIVTVAAAATLTATPASAEEVMTIGPVATDELHVMTFNLRFASDQPPNSWPERRPVMRKLLRDERPAIIGTQEGLFEQLNDIQADLPDHYRSIGEGREGGSRGEAMQVFYDNRRLTALEFGHYWLSDTPDVVGSKTWGGCCPRMVTWIRFVDNHTGTQFYLANTHFEAFDAQARENSANLMLDRMGKQFDPSLPVIVTGDFNEAAGVGNTVYDLLVSNGPLDDSWEKAEQRSALYATFHGYQPLVPNGNRIDWILTTPEVTSRVSLINTYQTKGQFPSDHLPVQAVLKLPVD